jgi:NarL family two-component system response regulator YdfI
LIRVGLLSPTLAVRVGLRALLEAEPQIDVVFEASSIDDLPGDTLAVDVLILTSDTLSTLESEYLFIDAQPDTAVLLLGDDIEAMRMLAELGQRAWGVLLPEFSQEELLAAVQALFEGLIVGEPSMMVSLMETPIDVGERTLDELVEALTEREQEVLQLLAQGLANKQIAAQLGISAHTVKFHISSIYGKLGATNRTEAVRIGLQAGLILL